MEGIHYAIRDNEFNVLVDILSANPDIDLNVWYVGEDNDSLENPLFLAALYCNLEIVEYLVSHGADINIHKVNVGGVLDYLVSTTYTDSHLPIVEYFVKKGADISPESFQMALILSPEVVQIYIQTYSKEVVMDTDCWIMAIEKQMDFELIEYFIGAPDFVMIPHWLVQGRYKDEDTVGFLENTQKNLNKFIEKKSWENAMRFILVHSYSSIFNSIGGCVDEKARMVETIIENMTDFSYVDSNGMKFVDELFRKFLTPELFKHIDQNIAKKLLEAGADKIILTEVLTSYLLNDGDEDLSNDEAEMDIVKKYVEAGADLNIPYNTHLPSYRTCNKRPIHAACGHQTRQVIEYLIEHGADINIKDENLGTALAYLIRVETDKIDFSLIESFVVRGADIKDAFHFALKEFKHELLRCLMRAHKKSRYHGSKWETWELETEYYVSFTIGRELDFDILEYFIEAPDLVFQDLSISRQTSAAEALQYIYMMLNQFMEKKSWENALRLILVYLYSFDLTFDNHYSLDGSEDKKTGIIETILENLTDFSYVDPKGTKFVDAMFNKYIELELFKQIDGNVGKKLLEAGADRKILNEALNNYLNLDEFDIDIVKQFIEIGVDLNSSLNHNGEETPLCDTVYMVSALHGHFELAEEMIAKGANLGCILLSKEIEKMLEKNHFLEDRLPFVVDKLIAGGFLKDRNTKMGPRATPFVDLFEYHDCALVLVKFGLLPKTPRGLTVSHSGVSCCLSWEPADGNEDFPVTGYLIQSWHIYYERWEKVATIEGRETNKYEVSGLKTGDVVKFRVLSRNYYGISVPIDDTESPHKVLVLPSPPGKPDHEVMGNDITITWAPPVEGGYRALTEYRVEVGNKGQDWRILGTCVVSYYDKIQWDRKMKIFDFKRLNFNQVRVIAVNNDGESEPSESNVEI